MRGKRLVGWRGQWFTRVGGTPAAPSLIVAKDAPPIGAVLAVQVKGVQHEGLWTGTDVIHKSARRGVVARESLAKFGGRHLVTVDGLVPPESIDRAIARIGEPWTPIRNCQRFVVEVSGVPRPSRDAKWVLVALTGAAIAASRLVGR